MKLVKFLVIISCVYSLVLPHFCVAQNTGTGVVLGISANIGTKVNRIGLAAGTFAFSGNLQLSIYWNGFFAANSYGPDLKKLESQLSFGILGAFGPDFDYFTMENRQFYSPMSNHTGKKHSAGLVLKNYTDNIGTTQNSGLVGISLGRASLQMENDLFILKGSDRYRTGAMSFIYQVENYQVGISALLWTGSSLGPKAKKYKGKTGTYPSRHGYYDLSETIYGKYSHGILALDAQARLPYFQSAGIRAGIDAEQVRHTLQNKFLHDMPFIPEKWNNSINPHFPMLTPEGDPFVYKEGQKVRKPVFFGDISLNPTLFY